MVRNVVLLVSTFATLGVLFVGYWILVDDSIGNERAGRGADATLPVYTSDADGPRLPVAEGIEVPPGEGLEFTVYDERTGRPTQHFQCSEWTPVSGAKDEILVTEPQLSVRLPSGMVATISARKGQITVRGLERAAGKPERGALHGDVRILIDLETRRERAPAGERPEDFITIALDHLRFDYELGELHTDGPIEITGTSFEITGSGLDLVWNQADNVVESLLLHQGKRLVLHGGVKLFRAASADTSPAAAESSAAADQPAKPAGAAPRSEPGRVATYTCVISGNVVAEQFAGDEPVGGLTADEVRVLFDVGGTPERLMGRSTTSAPADQPEPQQRERLVVRWNGPLRLEPGPAAAAADRPRRHFEARGQPVTLTHADGVGHCGRLEYYDETQQVWLHPAADGRVDFAMGADLSASASSVYIDQANNLVKLIGSVSLTSWRGDGQAGWPQSVRCSLWAELRLAPAPAAAVARQPRDELFDSGRLEAATFIGDARVDLGGQTLTAHRIDATFEPLADDQPLDTALDRAVATGGVRLAGDDESLECERLELAFALTDDGKPYPRSMEADGSVLIARGRSWIHGDHVGAEFEPAPPEVKADGPTFVLRTLDISGDAELRDPGNKVAARAAQISAAFTGINRLSRATIRGTAERYGRVHASPYTVGGARVDLDWDAQTVHVDGPARLRFKARRSLQGIRRKRAVPIDVACTESLHIDGRGNTVHFAGSVVAQSGAEQLKADTLTLLLEDVAEPEPAAAEPLSFRELLQQARQLLTQQRGAERGADLLELQVDERDRLRKEPLRLIAENALVQSETYAPGDEQPLVHSSISAPLLEVDIVWREIATRGRTILLLTSRRFAEDQPPQREVLGIPSSLIGRGPSQTAMQCDRAMTYVLGPEGSTRRDSVLFEGGVLLVHRTGREMENIEQMLPQVQTNPELISNLKSRRTLMRCDRLECGFLVAGEDRAAQAAPGRSGIQFNWLLASGSAYLRDVQGGVIREVRATQFDFDRTIGLIRVLGRPGGNARIYEENPAASDSRVLTGAEFIIDLTTSTIRSGPTRGEFRQQ